MAGRSPWRSSGRAGGRGSSSGIRGIGIEASALERIFEKGGRGESSRHSGGLGLGLYVCRQIVEAMEGTIAVESVRGQGATFVVDLPLRPAHGLLGLRDDAAQVQH